MDDFAPTEPYGLGTCIVAAHATRVFAQVEVIESNGLIFDDAYFGFTRGMVHLAGIKRATLELDSVSLLAARVLGKRWKVSSIPSSCRCVSLDPLSKTEPANVFGRTRTTNNCRIVWQLLQRLRLAVGAPEHRARKPCRRA